MPWPRVKGGPCGPSGAFTLLEVLVATAVAALLMVVLFSIIGESMLLSRRTVNSLLASNSGASAMDVLGADLAGLMPLEGGAEYLCAIPQTQGGATNSYLRFLAATPNNLKAADPASPKRGQPGFVTYRVARYDSETLEAGGNPPRPSWALFRSVLTGTATFALMGIDDIATDQGATPAMEDFFANNVVEFSTVFLRSGTTVQSSDLEMRLRGNSPVGAARPDAVLLTLITLDEEGAQRLRDGVWSMEEAKRLRGRVLTRRIPLRDFALP